ncbi:MAG TPA: FecR domain-containing protein [Trichormus sp. M33_DOE_039]|nr:FecR domain-containing protein [Trichormus sp. M33_DOE_039]
MRFQLSSWLAIGLWGVVILLTPVHQVNASTPLTRAEIQSLRNFVQLLQRNTRSKRPAKRTDAIVPGDGLATGRASLADLRFNDGSLARVGEQAIFQFLPRTRNFRLSNGTVLLLIPPGRGQTRIQTPSAVAAIRGSALFVRYDQQTDTTVIGALTNSGITVSNKDASQAQELQAGQLLVLVKGRFQGLYDFDLQNFYQTSDLVKGLDLTRQNLTPSADPAIASVQTEIVAALAGQTPLSGQGVIENPSFLELTASSNGEDTSTNLTANSNSSSVESFFDTGEILFNNAQELANSNDKITIPENNIGSIPTVKPTTPPPSMEDNSLGEKPGNPGDDKPVEPPTDTPGNPGNDKPVGNAGENPGNSGDDKPIEPPNDTLGNPGDDKPVEPPTDTPGNPGNDKPVGNAGENPGNSGNDKPVEPPTDTPRGS